MPNNEETTIDLENVEIAKSEAMDTSPEDFYAQADSIYVKLQYFPDTGYFRFEVKNELLNNYDPTNVPPQIMSLCAFVRGMVEVALSSPANVAMVGVKAMNADTVEADETLTPEQKHLFNTKPSGNA